MVEKQTRTPDGTSKYVRCISCHKVDRTSLRKTERARMSVQQRHWIRARRERGTAHMIADHSDRFAHRGAHLPTAQPPGGDASTVGSDHRRPPATNTFCAAPCAPSRRLSRQQGAKSDANRWQSCGWPASMRGSEAAELLHAGVSKHIVALRMCATPLQPAAPFR